MSTLKVKIGDSWETISSRGNPGNDGKSAYQYAVDGGYTGTEAEFAAKMAAEVPEQVQPDWNQNDSTAADYVKNRPFYTGDLVETELFDVCALVDAAGDSWVQADGGYLCVGLINGYEIVIDTPPAIGDECMIKYNGSSYACIAEDGANFGEDGAILLGDITGVTTGNFSYGVFIVIAPYTLVDSSDTSGRYVLLYAADFNGATLSELKVIGKAQEITKLDRKFLDLPDFPAETDPTVPDWAKQETKPSYTAEEVGALPSDTVVPFIVTVDKNGNVDHTADEIIDAANNGKVCLLIHMGLDNAVYNYSSGLKNNTYGSSAFFGRSTASNNSCAIEDSKINGTTKARVYRTSFEQIATGTSAGVIKIGNGLESAVGSDGKVQVSWIMNSSTEGSTKKFKLSVDDSGTLSTTEVT